MVETGKTGNPANPDIKLQDAFRSAHFVR